jgi:HEAT repeat protein
VLLAALLVLPADFARATEPSPPSAPASHEVLRAQIVALLQQPDPALHETDWKPLGPAALTVLEELAADPHAPSLHRVRAVAALAVVDHPEAVHRLRALLEEASGHPTLRASAALALGLRVGPDSLSVLLPFLQDRQEQVREAVALAIGRLGSLEAQQALEERLALEDDLLVREAIQQGLTLSVP